ncbi:hypothetical protein [Chelatococcus sp. XZ-Ab1]|uniref:hypothetical protein n=1 Tax=Chelatococcus sp. XZ-Ab1 TaxID=3034027 RepID=UPI0023E3F3CF|nr:hypothetical protein [Chelatococcus sp. XZ-Ab1]
MKALTVWQPWASLIGLSLKPYEFRGWPAPRALIGQRIAIHAGARPVRREEIAALILRLRGPEAWTTCLRPEALAFLERVHRDPSLPPRSHVVCTAVLGTPVRSWQIVGEFGGFINDSSRNEHSNWAWPLSDVQPLEPPIAARGAQGFWDWKRHADAA